MPRNFRKTFAYRFSSANNLVDISKQDKQLCVVLFFADAIGLAGKLFRYILRLVSITQYFSARLSVDAKAKVTILVGGHLVGSIASSGKRSCNKSGRWKL